jgi:hypothetical protein
MRRADRAARQNHLARRAGRLDHAAARKLDPGRTFAVKRHAPHHRVGDDLQVRPLQRRAQIGARRALPSPAPPRLLHPANIVAGAGRQMVDVLMVFEADLGPGLDDSVAKERLVGCPRRQQRPAIAVKFVRAALPVLGLLEVGQHALPIPAAIAELPPMIEILRLTAHIDHAVDR